ncbi:MAG: glycosyltransferase family 4 protein [Candidatus Omnitrophica bacterium]|nr:glycosyltransferase family 4 protein [Candidatus Omnitrophota bacterium]
MNIYIISGTFPEMHCGVGDFTYRFCSELKKYGLTLNIVTTKNPQIKPLEGVTVTQLIKSWNFSGLFTLLDFFKKNKADIIHIQYPTQSYKDKAMINVFPVFLKLFLPKIRLIVTMHDIATAHIFNKIRAIPFFMFCDKIVLTVSEEKEYLAKKMPFLRSKLEVIHISSNIKPVTMDSGEKKLIRQKLGVLEGETLISNFGYILPKKGLETLLYCLKILKEEGSLIKLIFISEFLPQENKYHASLKGLACSLNVSDLIIWTGYCPEEEASRYLLSSDICVELYDDGVSYRRGSFLAALCHGLPVIVNIKEKLPDGLKDSENILAVPVKDAKKLADAVKKLIASGELRARLGCFAKELSEIFSYENVAKEYFDLYNSVLQDR